MADETNTEGDTTLREGEVVGEYRVESKLGEGGFGAVYRAVHPLIGKAAAIKVLHRQYSSSPQMIGRFVAEARAVNQIRHRNIIDIFSFGALPDGRQYYVMELLEGMPFDRFLDERGPLPPALALPILRQMARALDAAHAAGIAHRDLKPENIFLVMDGDGDIFPKLLDFGIAKLLHDDASPDSGSVKTRTGTPMGTPYYMSPEQCRGQNVDHRTDIYSFGVMTFKVLTGQVPFDAPAVVELLYRHLSEKPPLPSSVRPELGPAFDAPVLRMLEKNPGHRPATVTAAVDELLNAAIAAGLSVPVPTGYSPGSLPSIPLPPVSQARPSGGSVTSQTPATLVAPGVLPAVGRRRGPPPAALAALGLLGLLGLGVAWVQHSRPGERPEIAPAASAAKGAPGEAAAPLPAASSAPAPASASVVAPVVDPAPGQVELTITQAPASTEVFLGATRLGAAPGPLRIKQGATPLKLTLRAPGHQPRTFEFVPVASGSVEAGLTRVATKGPAKAPGAPGDLEKPY